MDGKCPIICNDDAEWHLPYRVMRQFCLRQHTPNYVRRLDSSEGKRHNQWMHFLNEYRSQLDHRLQYVVEERGNVGSIANYMRWYSHIT